jgi:formylglycine-generating enzyme required for sulfatase activity
LPQTPYNGLPLGTLLDELHRQGFELSPDRVIRIEQALAYLLVQNKLENLVECLCYYLAPLVASDAASQERFYGVFDEWAKKLEEKTGEEEKVNSTNSQEKSQNSRIRKAIARLGIGALLICCFYLILLKIFRPEPSIVKADFTGEADCVEVGDQFQFIFLSPDTTLPRRWEFGDGTFDTISLNPTHAWSDTGHKFVSLILGESGNQDTGRLSVHVIEVGPKPNAKFVIEKIGANRYKFAPESIDTARFEYFWDFEGGEALPRRMIGEPDSSTKPITFASFLPDRDHYITLRVHLKTANGGIDCDDVTTQRLDLKQELIPLPAALSARMEAETRTRWTLLAWFLPLVLALMGLLGWMAYDIWRRRPPETPQFLSAFADGDGPPVHLDFPDTTDLPRADEPFEALAGRMRQRNEGEAERLDLMATLRATVAAAGFPDFRYTRPSRATEYLALVQSGGDEDQQGRLFRRFLERLQQEQVVLDIWYFTDDLRHCHRPGGETASLTRLLDAYAGARLLVYGEAKALLAPFTHQLLPGIARTLGGWEQKAWFTPLPPADWSRPERIAAEYFLLLPADLSGQLESQEAWQERHNFDFHALQRHFMRQGRYEASTDYDFTQAADLEAWLGPERFQWLCATALYPRPVWEITLALGRALSPGQVTFDDLLRLTRIPWLQSGDLSETLRAELVARLTPENETTARQVLKTLLEQANPPENSFAAQEKAIQLAVQQALLYPDDPQQQAALRDLWEKGVLDPLHRGVARKQQAAEETARKRRPLMGGFAAAAVALLGWLLMGLLKPPATWQNTGLSQQLPVDSAAWYVNAAADALDSANTNTADRFSRRAVALAPGLAEARYNRVAYHYLQGRLYYQNRQFGPAQTGFDSAATAATNGLGLKLPGYEPLRGGRDAAKPDATYLLLQHSLHGLGLSRYYEGNREGAEAIRAQMDSTYFTRYSPNLLTLLGGDALRRQVAQALAQADSLWDALRPGLEDRNALEADAALIVLSQAYESVLALDPVNARATARLEAVDELRRRLLPVYEVRGTVVDDSTGQPLRGVQVGWWDGSTFTDANGAFTLKVQEEERGNKRVDLALQREGFENLYVTVTLPPTTQRLRLKRVPPAEEPVRVTGHFTSPKGDPIPNATLTGPGNVTAAADAQGRYTLTLPAGTREASLTATAPGYQSQTSVWRAGAGNADFVLIPFTSYSDPWAGDMVAVSGGTFQMGSSKGGPNEKPVHSVTVGDFWIGKNEVMVKQWRLVMGENHPRLHHQFLQCDSCPVENVTWPEVKEFISELNRKTGGGYRLPTEAEWEYAAGGGSQSRTKWAGTNNEAKIGDYAWIKSNSAHRVYEVGKKLPNALGLYDMIGNVWEYCEDDWQENHEGAQKNGKAVILNPRTDRRVMKGGSFDMTPNQSTITSRSWYNVKDDDSSVGFRLARSY